MSTVRAWQDLEEQLVGKQVGVERFELERRARLNPHLDDRSPARLLREGELDEAGPLVLAAARAFQVGG